MKKYFIAFFSLLLVSSIRAQVEKINLDFVITMDDKILTTLVKPRIQLLYNNNNVKNIEVYYHPGMLSFDKADFEVLMSDNVKSVRLQFSYYKNSKTWTNQKDYDFELKKVWLSSLYNVLVIYNLDQKPYKGKYAPLDKDKNYTFELLSPDYSFTRIKKK